MPEQLLIPLWLKGSPGTLKCTRPSRLGGPPGQSFVCSLFGQELHGEVQQLLLARQARTNVNLGQEAQLQRSLALLTPG